MPADLPFTGIAVPADFLQVRRLAEWLRDRCQAAGLGDGAALDLELALVEAANNIVEHGGDGTGTIALDFFVDRGTAVVTLSDSGIAAPQRFYSECREVPLDAESGRGMGIVRSCVDAIQYETKDGHNTLTLTKLL
ncbi:ATP-binding protein [Tsuneonella sp. HG222]